MTGDMSDHDMKFEWVALFAKPRPVSVSTQHADFKRFVVLQNSLSDSMQGRDAPARRPRNGWGCLNFSQRAKLNKKQTVNNELETITRKSIDEKNRNWVLFPSRTGHGRQRIMETTFPDLEQGPLSDTSFQDDDDGGAGIVNHSLDS